MSIRIVLDDKTSRYSSKLTKRKLSGMLTTLERQNADIAGTCTIEYSRGFWNAFSFKSSDEFLSKGLPCLEKDLIDEFS